MPRIKKKKAVSSTTGEVDHTPAVDIPAHWLRAGPDEFIGSFQTDIERARRMEMMVRDREFAERRAQMEHERARIEMEYARRTNRAEIYGLTIGLDRGTGPDNTAITVNYGHGVSTSVELERHTIELMGMDRALHHIAREHARHYMDRIVPLLERAMRDAIEDSERRRALNLRAGGINFVNHHVIDRVIGIMHGPSGKPEQPEPFTHLADYPHTISHGQFEGTLLLDTMMVWNEADAMRHCLYRSYSHRMVRGDYLAYHVRPADPNGVPSAKGSGYTLGMKLESGRWKFDQMEGKARSKADHPGLKGFCEAVETKLNEVKNGKSDITPETVNLVRATRHYDSHD